jgi:hypothetical protein
VEVLTLGGDNDQWQLCDRTPSCRAQRVMDTNGISDVLLELTSVLKLGCVIALYTDPSLSHISHICN